MAKSVDHESRAHAVLSASGASRWMNCTPSARLEEEFEEKRDSDFAAEGTLAHEFGDLGLQLAMGFITQAEYGALVVPHLRSKFYKTEMDVEVQKYIDYCMESFNVAKKKTHDAEMLIEEKFDLTYYIEDGFGTGDDTIVADGTMEIIDLKYGKGIRVSAEDNDQLKIYGLGALRKYDLMYDIHTVKLTIVQPRLDHISSWTISAKDLIEWGESVVIPLAQKAYKGEGLQKAGTHCKWCRAKGRCATFASQALSDAKADFMDEEKPKDIRVLTDEQLIEVYARVGLIQDWINAIEKQVLTEALDGKIWPDYKLVEGRSTRKWKDEKEVYKTLSAEGYTNDEIQAAPKLLGIGAIEKLVKKANFNDLLGGLVIKPAGKPTLVPVSDKRTALPISAKDDFKDILN